MRGRSKAQIIDALRARRSAGVAREAESSLPAPAAEEETVAPLADSLDSFWSAAGGLPDVAVSLTPPEVDAWPVKRLGPPPFWRSKSDFTALMEQAYRSIGEEALRLALGEAQDPQ